MSHFHCFSLRLFHMSQAYLKSIFSSLRWLQYSKGADFLSFYLCPPKYLRVL